MIYLVSIACQAAMGSGLRPALNPEASHGADSVGRLPLKARGESSKQQLGGKCCEVFLQKNLKAARIFDV